MEFLSSLVVLYVIGCILGFLIAAGALVWFVLARPKRKEVVRAQQFELVDSQGKVRALLAMLPDGGPILALYDKGGKAAANLSLLPGESPMLALHDSGGKTRALLNVRPDGSPMLALFDREGKVIWQAP